MTQLSNEFLGTEKISRLLVKLAIPAITAQVVNMLYNIVDRIYLGHLADTGTLALTGVGLCFPVITLIMAFSNLVGMGGAPLASIRLGAKDQKSAEQILGNSFSLLLILAAVLTIVFSIWGKSLLFSFGASSDTIVPAFDYLRIYVLGTPFVMIALGLNPFISAQGFAQVSMRTTVIGAVTNIILDPIFIFLLDLGVQGAAAATVLSQCVSAVWVLLFLFGKKTILRIKPSGMKIQKALAIPSLALGLSPFIMTSTESLLTISFNTSLQRYGGDLVVGAMTIISSISQIGLLPLQGLSQGAQPIISYNFGAKKMDRVTEAFRFLFILSFGFSTGFCLLNLLFPKLLPSIFASNTELLSVTASCLRVYVAGLFMFGVQISCQQTFIALGQAKISLLLALLRKVILLIPLIYILPYLFDDKVFAVFLAEPIADILAAVTTFCLFCKTVKKLHLIHAPDRITDHDHS